MSGKKKFAKQNWDVFIGLLLVSAGCLIWLTYPGIGAAILICGIIVFSLALWRG